MASLSEEIKQKALETGFHKVGIVRAEPLVKEANHLREWLAENYHGEMLWMEREPEKRVDPNLLFAEAKSIIVVAHNYFTPHQHEENPAKGKVSRYAWGDDYHDVLKEKLREIAAFIKSIDATVEAKICVDTAPIMDKAWAVRAGLGWIGKHSNLITKDYGSWVFLGEILLNLELEYDAEVIEDHCGTCTACLEACPTQAIVEPYTVDSRKCLSYTTIELRAPDFPETIVKDLSGWLYGCDICQDVCPWNRFEKPTDEQRFAPREGNITADLDEILSLSPEKYAEKFRRSAMKRTKLGGLQRNARALKKSNEK